MKVVGKDLEDLVRLRADIDHTLTGNPRAKAALETAMYDALARSYHIPLFLMLGGRYRKEIKVIKMVSVDVPEAMAEEAKQLVRDGLSLKLKVSGKIDQDLPRVAAVRKAVGDDVFIKVDANEAYDAKTAIRLGQRLADHGVKFSSSRTARPLMRCGKSKNIRRSRSKRPIGAHSSRTRKWSSKSHGGFDQHGHSESRQHRRSEKNRRVVRAERHPPRVIEHGGQHGRRRGAVHLAASTPRSPHYASWASSK